MLKKISVAFLCVACIATMCFVPLSASANVAYTAEEFHAEVASIGALTGNKLEKIKELLDFSETNSVNAEDVTTLNSYKAHIEANNEAGWYYTDDFDNYQPESATYGWWECINADTILDDFDKVVTKQGLVTENFVQYKDGTEGIVKNGSSGNCLAISALPSTAAKTLKSANNSSNIPAQIFALPDSVLNGKGIIKAGFKAYWSGSNRTYSLILSKQDNQHYTAIQLANGNGIKKATCNIDSNTFCTEEALVKSSDLNGYYYATWVDVTLEYITKDDGNYYRVTFLSPNISKTEANADNLTDVVEVKVDTPISNLYFTGSNIALSKQNYNHRGIDDVKIAVTDKPIVEGTTIRSGSDVEMKDQTLQFNMDFSFAKYSVPANATDIEYGVLFVNKSVSQLNLQTTGIKKLDYKVSSSDEIDTDVSIYITDSTLNSGNSGKKCSVRAYIKYNVGSEEIVIYSENSDTDKGIKNGIQNKSLIGTVKSILLSFAPSGASDENFAAAVAAYNTEYDTRYTAEQVWRVVTSANAAAAKQIIADDANFTEAPTYTYRFVMYTVLCLMQNQ